VLHDLVLAPDHETEPPVEPEDATARADVDIVDASLLQRRGAVDVVAIERVAPVDDDVAGLHPFGQLVDGGGHEGGRHHDPRRARSGELAHEVVERRRADRPFALELLDGRCVDVVHDALVTVLREPPNQVGAHASEADHAQLHLGAPPFLGTSLTPSTVPRST
jgi:hypothetical protein